MAMRFTSLFKPHFTNYLLRDPFPVLFAFYSLRIDYIHEKRAYSFLELPVIVRVERTIISVRKPSRLSIWDL